MPRAYYGKVLLSTSLFLIVPKGWGGCGGGNPILNKLGVGRCRGLMCWSLEGPHVMMIFKRVKMALRCFKIAQAKLKMAPRGPQNGPKMASAGAKSSVKYIVKYTLPQDGFELPYDSRRWPKIAQDRHKTAQDGPRWPPKGPPKGPSKWPKRVT